MNFGFTATPDRNRFKDALQTAAFFGGYFVFAVLGSLASVACFVPAVLFHGVRAQRFGQKLIRALFGFFVGYLRALGLVELDARELSRLRDGGGLIVVANHPCLLDAVLVGSQLPRMVCLMKGGLARNLALSGTSRLAGYVRNESGLGLVKKCAERLTNGANLLVFPEGTRTRKGKLHPFKMGFALVAILTQAPVQTLLITAESNYLGKGWPFFKKPSFPLRYKLSLGKRFQPAPGMDVKTFGGAVENYFRTTLPGLQTAPVGAKS
jgi:1-acyl-sn-glycerol-3-phosphate acyltransferase